MSLGHTAYQGTISQGFWVGQWASGASIPRLLAREGLAVQTRRQRGGPAGYGAHAADPRNDKGSSWAGFWERGAKVDPGKNAIRPKKKSPVVCPLLTHIALPSRFSRQSSILPDLPVDFPRGWVPRSGESGL